MFDMLPASRARVSARARAIAARALCAAGGRSVDGYARAVGKRPAVLPFFVEWGERFRWAYRRAAQAHAGLMVHLSTYNGPGTKERITPRAIAIGRDDGYLVTLGRDFAAHGGPVHVRLFSEMNNAANPYCGFRHDGAVRDESHRPRCARRLPRPAIALGRR